MVHKSNYWLFAIFYLEHLPELKWSKLCLFLEKNNKNEIVLTNNGQRRFINNSNFYDVLIENISTPKFSDLQCSEDYFNYK